MVKKPARPSRYDLIPPLRPAGLPAPSDGLCTWDGSGVYEPCQRPHFARGLCSNHYRVVRRRDDPAYRGKDDARFLRWEQKRAERFDAPRVTARFSFVKVDADGKTRQVGRSWDPRKGETPPAELLEQLAKDDE